MKLKEISVDEDSSPSERSTFVDNEKLKLLRKLEEENRKNEEIRQQLSLEKARADRLQKKVQFIQDNQDLFNQLKEAYASMKEKGNLRIEIQDSESQTSAMESFKNSTLDITTVSKKDLAEVNQLVRELKSAVAKGGKKLFTVLETDKHRDLEERHRIEIENEHLRRELYQKSSELDRLRLSAGSGPREVALLRRIVAKLMHGVQDFSCLSNRECQLAKHITKKYELRRLDTERKMADNMTQSEEENVVKITAYETPRTPHSPTSPNGTNDVFSTPRWVRAEDVP